MSNPNSGLYWLIGLVCCPGPLGVLIGILLATAYHRGMLRSPIDPERAPSLRWQFWRHDRE